MAAALEDPSLEIAYRVGGGTGYADADGRSVALDRTRLRALRHARVPRWRADRRDRARSRARRAQRARRRRRDGGAAGARSAAARRAASRLRARAAQLPGTDPGRRRRRAAADRARPPRRRPAAAGRAADEARAHERAQVHRPGPCGGARGRARRRDRWGVGEIRGLARGIYPPLLASHGLGEALDAVAVAVRCRRRCWWMATGAIRARSRARSTSAAARPCRTWPSTRKARPARPSAWSATTAGCRSRSTTTAPASTWSARTPVPAS